MAKIVVSQFVSSSTACSRTRAALRAGTAVDGPSSSTAAPRATSSSSTSSWRVGRPAARARTYEGFAEAWPSRTDEFADKFNGMRKYVVSGSMDNAEWTNSVIVRPDDLVDTVTRLREEPGGDVLVNGSAEVVEALRANDLVDEYRLMVFPIVLGAGKRMFAGDSDASTVRRSTRSPRATP